jgi:hypothetical protein
MNKHTIIDYQGRPITLPVMAKAQFDAVLHGDREAGVYYTSAPGNSLRIRYVVSNALSAVARKSSNRSVAGVIRYAASRIRIGLPISKRVENSVRCYAADNAWKLIKTGDESCFVQP